jgi:hypothetical protein
LCTLVTTTTSHFRRVNGSQGNLSRVETVQVRQVR